MEAVIRPMEALDLAACAAIEATALDAWSLDQLQEELTSPAARLFVAQLPPKQIAGLAVFQLAAGEASLCSITVDPAFHRQGIGRRLLLQSLALLRQQGAESCYLEVRSQNQAAQGLYSSLGFAAAGRRRGFYKNPADDALVMSLDLNAVDFSHATV